MTVNNEKEKIEGEIKLLQKKLDFLEQLEKTKTPCEIAYKRVYGNYPTTNITDGCWDSPTWMHFVNGYKSAQKDYKVGEYQETAQERGERLHKDVERVVKESVKWCEEHPNESVEDWLKPQTHQQVADGLKEAFREAIKQGVVSSIKSKTLTDLIYRWWGDVFTTHSDWDMETSIEDLVDQIELFLPKEQSAAGSQNAYVESAVEGFNDAIKQIKSKLR